MFHQARKSAFVLACAFLAACQPQVLENGAGKTDASNPAKAGQGADAPGLRQPSDAGVAVDPSIPPSGPIPIGDIEQATDPDVFSTAFSNALRAKYPVGVNLAVLDADLKASGFSCVRGEANPAGRVVAARECQLQVMRQSCGNIWHVKVDKIGLNDGDASISAISGSFERLCLGAG